MESGWAEEELASCVCGLMLVCDMHEIEIEHEYEDDENENEEERKEMVEEEESDRKRKMTGTMKEVERVLRKCSTTGAAS